MRCDGCGKVEAACKCPNKREERRWRSKPISAPTGASNVIALNTAEHAEQMRQKRAVANDSAKRDKATRNREHLQGVRRRKK